MNVDLPDVEVVHRASVYDSNLSKSRGKGYRNQANSLVEVLIRPRISTDGLIRPRSSRCSSCDQFFFFSHTNGLVRLLDRGVDHQLVFSLSLSLFFALDGARSGDSQYRQESWFQSPVQSDCPWVSGMTAVPALPYNSVFESVPWYYQLPENCPHFS